MIQVVDVNYNWRESRLFFYEKRKMMKEPCPTGKVLIYDLDEFLIRSRIYNVASTNEIPIENISKADESRKDSFIFDHSLLILR